MQLCSSILVLPTGFEDFAPSQPPHANTADALGTGGANGGFKLGKETNTMRHVVLLSFGESLPPCGCGR